MIYLVIGIIIYTLIYYWLDALHDYHFIQYGKPLGNLLRRCHSKAWHIIDTIIKLFNTSIIIGLGILWLFSGWSVPEVVYDEWQMLGIAVSLMIVSLSIRWLWFDGWLYYWSRWGFFHVGTTATMDKFFSKILPTLLFVRSKDINDENGVVLRTETWITNRWWYNNIKYSQFVVKVILIGLSVWLSLWLVNNF